MSLFPSTLTGRVLDDGVTEPPVIELQGISAGQLSLVLTQHTPLETTTQNTADIGTNAAAIAALQGQVSALPAPPDLTPYALAADLAAAEGLIAANASGLTAVNTSLTLGLASKANQSALDALQVQVDGKSTGFIAQDVQAAGKLGETLCKTMSGEEQLLALDYQKLSVVLWGVVKSLQKRVDKLEKKKRGHSD